MNKVKINKYLRELIPFHGSHFLTGNGYFGVRGTLEEYNKEHMPCINMAGIYDRAGDKWRESVNAPNPLYTYIVSGGKKYSLPDVECESHMQELDIYRGIHMRETTWRTEQGIVTVTCERFASMANQHAIGMKYSVCTNYDGEVVIVTGIDGDVWDINGPHFSELLISENDKILSVTGITGEKGISVTTQEKVCTDFDAEISTEKNDKSVFRRIRIKTQKDKLYTIKKTAVISSSIDDNPVIEDIKSADYDKMKNDSINAWENIWKISKIEINGDDEAEFALNYSIYHLNCIAPRNLKSKSIAARGLSGQVYKGAVFWDTEMFMIDYYMHTEPEVAKTLLKYRIDTINGARAKADEYGLQGAYYAWESQEGGFEGCSHYNIVDVFTKRPMRTYFRDKQYHVNGAVVYAFMKYINASGDYSILAEGGLETVIECARMYRSLLLKKADGSFFEVHDVVGPDEYHERVNNNAYSNRMIKFCFEKAAEYIAYAKDNLSECYNRLDEKYDLKKLAELFAVSAKEMLIKQPDKSGIIEQFDGYFNLEDTTVEEVRSRLIDPKEYWGGAYGVAADTQVIKQADVVAMLSMFKDDYSKDIMQKNLEYYEPRTEHGSSLSACMYSLLSCYTGDADAAYPLFMKSASADMAPGGKEWAGLVYIGGTHPASAGGAWIAAVKGFAGLDIIDGEPICRPCMPSHWQGMRFNIIVQGKLYCVNISKDKVDIKIQ